MTDSSVTPLMHRHTRHQSVPTSGKCALMSLLNPLLVQLRMPLEKPAQNSENWTKHQVFTPHQPWKRTEIRSDSSDADDNGEDDAGTSDSSSTAPRVHSVASPMEEPVQRITRPRDVTATSPRADRRGSHKKPRKPTYAVRKEEKAALVEELRILEARAELLRQQVGVPSQSEQQTLEKTQKENKAMQDAQQSHLLSLCGVQSTIGRHLRDAFATPMQISIRLGKDMAHRRATLVGLRRERLNRGRRYLDERLRGVDEKLPFDESASWMSAEGDFCFQRADISHFEGVQSLKQVYDALMFYMVNMEISISEQLGQLTLREDIDCVDRQISNHRIISSTDYGLVMEINSVAFVEYEEQPHGKKDQEFAMFTADSVDNDELYPYCPHERVRKNVTAVLSISSFRKPPVTPSSHKSNPLLHLRHQDANTTTVGEAEGELVVVLRRCAFVSITKPQFPVCPAALEDMRANVSVWGDVMSKTIRDNVYAKAVLAPGTINSQL